VCYRCDLNQRKAFPPRNGAISPFEHMMSFEPYRSFASHKVHHPYYCQIDPHVENLGHIIDGVCGMTLIDPSSD
jgi:hypothetical protein